jgi:hypothetical protein
MKPAWDKLMDEFKGSAASLVGDVRLDPIKKIGQDQPCARR